MLRPGLIVGHKYRLEEPIGHGGMATVWRARHTTLDRAVAVKFLEAVGSSSETLAARFLQEAKLAATLRHRHVVDIVDFGVHGGRQPYMVMELLEGQSLADRYDDGPTVSDWELLEIVCMTLSGLAAVHDAGIVHRDVKPENIFLVEDADGVFPKLLDFGISRGFEPKRGPRMTRTGAVVGTPQYMAPEQARGLRDVDGRADLWSVAVVLYEGLAGEVPFDSENPGDVLIMVATEDAVPLAHLRPDLPRELTDLVERGLKRNRVERFGEARDMRDALLAVLQAGNVEGGRPPPHVLKSTFGTPGTTGKLRALSSRPPPSSVAREAAALPPPAALPRAGAQPPPLPPREDSTEEISLAEMVPVEPGEDAGRASATSGPPTRRYRTSTAEAVRPGRRRRPTEKDAPRRIDDTRKRPATSVDEERAARLRGPAPTPEQELGGVDDLDVAVLTARPERSPARAGLRPWLLGLGLVAVGAIVAAVALSGVEILERPAWWTGRPRQPTMTTAPSVTPGEEVVELESRERSVIPAPPRDGVPAPPAETIDVSDVPDPPTEAPPTGR